MMTESPTDRTIRVRNHRTGETVSVTAEEFAAQVGAGAYAPRDVIALSPAVDEWIPVKQTALWQHSRAGRRHRRWQALAWTAVAMALLVCGYLVLHAQWTARLHPLEPKEHQTVAATQPGHTQLQPPLPTPTEPQESAHPNAQPAVPSRPTVPQDNPTANMPPAQRGGTNPLPAPHAANGSAANQPGPVPWHRPVPRVLITPESKPMVTPSNDSGWQQNSEIPSGNTSNRIGGIPSYSLSKEAADIDGEHSAVLTAELDERGAVSQVQIVTSTGNNTLDAEAVRIVKKHPLAQAKSTNQAPNNTIKVRVTIKNGHYSIDVIE